MPSTSLSEIQLADQLRELLTGVGWLRGWKVDHAPSGDPRRIDLVATIPLAGGHSAELWVECKTMPRPSQFPYVTLENTFSPEGTRSTRLLVLAAPYISPRMAELCQKHGWGWFDLAGNCRINVPHGFLIERTGFPPLSQPRTSRPQQVKLSTPEASTIVRTLLGPEPPRRWTQRDLAAACQPPVSLGLVNKIVTHLRNQAYLTEREDTGFTLHDPVGLLTAWRNDYHFDRHQRLGYFTLHHGRRLQEVLASLEPLSDGHAVLASFSAAELQAPHVRQPRTWLYIAAPYLEACIQSLEARHVDSGENLIVLVPDDPGIFWHGQTTGPGQLPCTRPVQTYVDLYHSGGRGKEAAEALLEQHLKPAWKAHGFNL